MLETLYSPEDVQAMFPEGRRPGIRRLIAKAKEAGCCCKLGRGIALTAEQVKTLIGYITCSGSNVIPRGRHIGTFVARSAESEYLKARDSLNARKQKNSGRKGNGKLRIKLASKSARPHHSPPLSLHMKQQDEKHGS